MKRNTLFLRTLCALMMSLLLIVPACAEEAAPAASEAPAAVQTETPAGEEASSSDGDDQSLFEKLTTTVNLPETYLITYSVEHEDGTVELVSYGKDSAGRYYIAKGGNEALFVPENSYYRQAGVEGQAYTFGHIKTQAQEFMAYAEGSLMQYAAGAEYVRTEEVCGRTADVYEIVRDILVFEYTACFAVDQETGVCLYMIDDSNIMGYELEPIQNVICIAFITENVVLPGTEAVETTQPEPQI